MRRLWSLAVGTLVLFAAAAPSFAFTTVAKTTTTASVEFSGSGITAFSIEIRVVDGGALASPAAISWNPSTQNIVPGTTGWKAALQYIVLRSTMTNASGGIQIYTDNKGAGADPVYTGIGNPAGLVGYSATDATLSSTTIPMCWRVVDTSTNTLTIVQGSDNKLYSAELGGQAGTFPCFAWMKDKNTPTIASADTTAFSDGEDYITVKEARRGIHYAEGPNIGQSWGSSASPDYIYFGANFSTAFNATYRTKTLRIESFTD